MKGPTIEEKHAIIDAFISPPQIDQPVPDTISQENIPDLIEAILPLWRDEIKLIQAKAPEDRTREDLNYTLHLMKGLNETYFRYRILKAELRRNITAQPQQELLKMIQAAAKAPARE